ncbi:PREDICTED: neurofilament heavy polypeptide-like, partial [Priapulus caudatus]|uniref:Neurofilament heavy polypeptide-like n=1 Tax=Priapulus caudatus TaxID=37621 RepID=A0ABM1E0H4_PRICU
WIRILIQETGCAKSVENKPLLDLVNASVEPEDEIYAQINESEEVRYISPYTSSDSESDESDACKESPTKKGPAKEGPFKESSAKERSVEETSIKESAANEESVKEGSVRVSVNEKLRLYENLATKPTSKAKPPSPARSPTAQTNKVHAAKVVHETVVTEHAATPAKDRLLLRLGSRESGIVVSSTSAFPYGDNELLHQTPNPILADVRLKRKEEKSKNEEARQDASEQQVKILTQRLNDAIVRRDNTKGWRGKNAQVNEDIKELESELRKENEQLVSTRSTVKKLREDIEKIRKDDIKKSNTKDDEPKKLHTSELAITISPKKSLQKKNFEMVEYTVTVPDREAKPMPNATGAVMARLKAFEEMEKKSKEAGKSTPKANKN